MHLGEALETLRRIRTLDPHHYSDTNALFAYIGDLLYAARTAEQALTSALVEGVSDDTREKAAFVAAELARLGGSPDTNAPGSD